MATEQERQQMKERLDKKLLGPEYGQSEDYVKLVTTNIPYEFTVLYDKEKHVYVVGSGDDYDNGDFAFHKDLMTAIAQYLHMFTLKDHIVIYKQMFEEEFNPDIEF